MKNNTDVIFTHNQYISGNLFQSFQYFNLKTNEVRFLTIPSVGDNMEFKISTIVQFQSPFSGSSTVAYVKGERC